MRRRTILSPLIEQSLSEDVRLGHLGEAFCDGEPFGLQIVGGEYASGKWLENKMTMRAIAGGLMLAAGTIALVCSAEAADLPAARMPAAAPMIYAPPVYNWTGFYVGGNVGGGFANSNWTDPFGAANNTFSDNSFIGGGQIGFNYQFNWLVVGLEGDFDWTGLKGSGKDSFGNTITTKTEWTSTVTGRVGAAFDRLLVYAKGGVAFAQDQSSLNDVFGGSASTNLTRTGWTAGAGLEYALAQNWTAKVEYDYLGFGSQALTLSTPNIAPYVANASLNVQEVKAGINYKFGP
jgi:outer membrane immunogenic protein